MDNIPLIRALLVFPSEQELAAVRRGLSKSECAVNAGQAGSVADALSALVTAPFDFVVASCTLSDGGAGDIALRYPIVPCIAAGPAKAEAALAAALDNGAVDYLATDEADWADRLGDYLHRLWRIRRRLATELGHVSKRYEDLVEALPDVIYELDVDGNFTFVNQAVKMLGYSPGELIGRHFSSILFAEDVPHVSREQVLPLYLKGRTGSRNAPKLFDERRGVDRKTENLELRIKRKSGAPAGNELIASVISYGEIASAGAYRTLGDVKEKVFVGTVGIIRDITLRRKSEDMLRKMYQAVDQSPVAVAILDRDLVIEYVNPSFFGMTGSGPDQAIGRRMADYLGEVSDPASYEDLINSIRSGIDWKGELLCPRSGADPFWSSVMVSAIRSPSGVVSHYLCLLEDVTRKRTLDDLLRHAKDAAEDASRAKSEFLANMSHELRTPLAGIISLAEVLISDEPKAGHADRLNAIRSSGKNLLAILNDLLDLSKIEARSVEVELEDFDLEECIKGALIPFRALAEEKGLQFRCDVDDGGLPRIRTDRGKVCQILSNLASNAIKFTESGSVDIRVAVRAKDELPALFVSVRDTGIGISGVDQQKLFKHFSQVDHTLSKKYGGTGLGLAISKELALKLGGDISVESAAGAGSTFSFFVPLMECEGLLDAACEDIPTARRRLNLLVAEDNAVNRDYLRYFLEKAGHRVELVGDGLQAIRALEKGDFDAVLMDIQMPGMDGISSAATIRSYTGVGFDPRIPVVALTAYGEGELGAEFRQADFDAHVTKPVNARSLIFLLDELARKKEYFDISRIKKQYAGSEDELRRLLLILSQDLPKRMADFERAHGEEDYGKGAEALHGMVSIFSAVGAIRAQQLVKRYRKAAEERKTAEAALAAEELAHEISGIKRQVKRTLGEL